MEPPSRVAPSPNARRRKKVEQDATLERLSNPLKKEPALVPLDVELLRPLVDLAYWSTFSEVRRDSAAAFATLAMNASNLPTLSQAGALGALLALLSTRGSRDSRVQKDAAVALAQLVTLDEVKTRLLEAPEGIQPIFQLCHAHHVEIKRSAVQTLANLCKMDLAKEKIVDLGGMRHLFSLTDCKDDLVKRTAAKVLRLLASHEPNKEKMGSNSSALKHTMVQLMESGDMKLWHDLIEFVTALASHEPNRPKLVRAGLLQPLVMAMRRDETMIRTCLLIVRCLSLLATHSLNKVEMVREGIMTPLLHIAFVKVPHFEAKHKGTSERRSPRAVKLSAKRKQSTGSLHIDVQRLSVSTLTSLAEHPKNRERLIEDGILEPLVSTAVWASRDKKVRRPVAQILVYLSDTGGPSERHEIMVEAGVIEVCRVCLESRDVDLQTAAGQTLSNLMQSPRIHRLLAMNENLIRALFFISATVPDGVIELAAASLCHQMCSSGYSTVFLAGCQCIPMLVKLLAHKYRDSEAQLRAVQSIAVMSGDPDCRPQLTNYIQALLGNLLSLSKAAGGLPKHAAISSLENLQQDAAALRIQVLFRGFLTRKKAPIAIRRMSTRSVVSVASASSVPKEAVEE